MVVEGNWLFLKPISIAFHDTPFSFHWSLKFRMSLTLKVAARPDHPAAPGPGQKQYFRFLWANGSDTGTLTHNGPLPEGPETRTGTTPGSHLKVRIIVGVSSSQAASNRGSIILASHQHPLQWTMFGKQPVNTGRMTMEMVPDLRNIPECLSAYKQPTLSAG